MALRNWVIWSFCIKKTWDDGSVVRIISRYVNRNNGGSLFNLFTIFFNFTNIFVLPLL